MAAGWLGTQSAGPAVVVCVGDSLTAGSALCPGYADLLPKLLRHVLAPPGRLGWRVANFGVAGATAIRVGAGASPYTQTPRFKEALRSDGDFVLIMFGFNDAREDTWDARLFVKDLSAIVAAFRRVREAPEETAAEGPHVRRPPARFMLLVPPPLYSHRGNANALQCVLHDTLPQRLLPFIARECGLGLVDLLTPMGGPELAKRWLVDRLDAVHPNEKGSEVMALAVRDALEACAATEDLPWQLPPPLNPAAKLGDAERGGGTPAVSSAMAALAGLEGAQLWRVVGGVEAGGLVVRRGRRLASEALEERLQTGAEVVGLEVAGGRLRYRRFCGEGPEEGWVSLSAQGSPLLQPLQTI